MQTSSLGCDKLPLEKFQAGFIAGVVKPLYESFRSVFVCRNGHGLRGCAGLFSSRFLTRFTRRKWTDLNDDNEEEEEEEEAAEEEQS
jgi:hypothetical protein